MPKTYSVAKKNCKNRQMAEKSCRSRTHVQRVERCGLSFCICEARAWQRKKKNDDDDDDNAMCRLSDWMSEHWRYTRAILYFPELIASISKYADFKCGFFVRSHKFTRSRPQLHTPILGGISKIDRDSQLSYRFMVKSIAASFTARTCNAIAIA